MSGSFSLLSTVLIDLRFSSSLPFLILLQHLAEKCDAPDGAFFVWSFSVPQFPHSFEDASVFSLLSSWFYNVLPNWPGAFTGEEHSSLCPMSFIWALSCRSLKKLCHEFVAALHVNNWHRSVMQWLCPACPIDENRSSEVNRYNQYNR